MFEQLWKKFASNDIALATALEAHGVRCRRRDFDIIASLIKAGDTEKAQNLLSEILVSMPVWDFLTITTTARLIAELLFSAGQFQSAAEFAERGLEWDPTHPELLALLCKCYATIDPGKAQMYYSYLKNIGYSDMLLEGYTPQESSKTTKEYSVTIDSFKKVSTESLLNLMVYQSASLLRRPLYETIDVLRAHALACIGTGNLPMAIVSLKLAMFRIKDPLYISGLNPGVIQIRAKWLRTLEQFVALSIENDSKAKAFTSRYRCTEKLFDRRHAVEDMVSAKNTAGLFSFVMDPAPEISFLACQYMIELGEEKKVRDYVNNAVITEQTYKEMYGELRPHLVQRMMSAPLPVVKAASDVKAGEGDVAEDVPAKKVVRRKMVAKGAVVDDDDDDTASAPKRTVRKKKVDA